MTDHDRVLAEGFLARSTARRVIRGWPAWVRGHVAACEVCRQHLMLRGLLGDATPARPPRSADAPPTLASLLARERRPSNLEVADLAEELTPFPTDAWRNRASASLTVTRTLEGVHVNDTEARELAVYAVGSDGRARTLYAVAEANTGVAVHLPLVVTEATRLVVLGAHRGLEPEMWRLWLQERARSGAEVLLEGAQTRLLHVAELRLLPPARPALLRQSRGAVMEATPAVKLLLSAGRALGDAGYAEEASRKYLEARTMALGCGDLSGELRAQIGVAATLVDAGFEEDAERVYRDVVARFELDDALAVYVCRGLAWRFLACGDLEAASGWIDELAARGPADDPYLARLRMRISLEQNDWAGVLRIHEEGPAEAEESDLGASGSVLRAVALYRLGREPEARAQVSSVQRREGWSSDIRLWWLYARMLVGLGGTRGVGSAMRLDAERTDVDGCVPSHWERRVLYTLATHLHDAGDVHGAHHAAELLCGGGASEGSSRIGVACVGAESLVVEAESGVRVSRVTRGGWQHLVRDVRVAVLRGEGIEQPAQILGDLLFNGPVPAHPAFSVASDGALAGLPWPALFAAYGRGLTSVVEVIHSPRFRVPTGTTIVSLADCDGTLPGASREVPEDQADVWLRGPRASFAALSGLGEVGLLHIGLHAARLNGVPTLFFGDGPASALDIAGLSLRGYPTVLLSGCATAEGEAAAGIECSLAHAFLRAGAAAVVATQWPVRDHEAAALFQPLVAAWPHGHLEGAVANVSHQLRAIGHAPRCWAAPIVYR